MRIWFATFAAVGWLAGPVALAQDKWAVPNADIRFEVEITAKPSEPCAGIIALLPDGGILPRTWPGEIVLDEAGKQLRSNCIWFNPREGMGIVFETPAKGNRAFIYLRPASQLNTPLPTSPFCPSLLLYTQPGGASLEVAKQLTGGRSPGQNGRVGLVGSIADRENPFGASDNFSSCYSGWLKPPEKGRYYIATISDDGSECLIDGKPVASWPGTKHNRHDGAKGEHGDWVPLLADRSRIEYFHFNESSQPEMHTVWRTPKDKPDALPMTVPQSAFVHSGTAKIAHVQTRRGTPIALFDAEPESYLWLGEQPVNLYRLQVRYQSEQPVGTKYRWEFEGGMSSTNTSLMWLIDGNAPLDVGLTASATSGVSRCVRPVYFARLPGGSSANSMQQRDVYRRALLTRCRAVPPPRRPCETWSANLWATLVGVVDPYAGEELMSEIFERSRQDVLALKQADRWKLEDIFWSTLRTGNKTRAWDWLDRLVKEEPDKARKFHWMLQKVEFFLYDVSDLDKARTVIDGLRDAATAGGLESTVRLMVRWGDIERLAGNVDEARKWYVAAENKYRTGKTDWRAEAVRQGAYYEMARNYLDQNALVETQRTLRDWELEFPLSKLSGEYPLIEARLWREVGRSDLAVKVLRVYREHVELSKYLPDMMDLELNCLVEIKHYDEIKALAKDINKRFPTLDLAQKANRLAQLQDRPKK